MEQQTVSTSSEKELTREMTQEELQIDEPVVSAVLDDEGEFNETDTNEEYEEDEEDEQEGGDSDSEIDNKVAIDLSDNDYYKGLCTLLEDEHGNNTVGVLVDIMP